MPETNMGSICRVTFEGTLYSQQMVNVFYFQMYNNFIPSAPSADVMTDFLTYLTDVDITRYLACLSNQYTLVKLTARTILEPEIVVEHAYTGTLPTGAVASEATATQVAGIVSWKTNYAGRRYRGRTYLPAVPESMLTLGFLEPAQRTAMDTWADWHRAQAFTGPGSSAWSANLVVLSDPDGVLPSSTTPAGKRQPTFDVVQSYVIRYSPGTQRRRKIGVGS